MEYDVFLSFRGADTRDNLTGHLYHALCLKEINTYIDDNGIPRGEEISQALLEAIEKSRISIIVLSPGYASSTWCLDELVKIVECMKTKGQFVHPVFHGIEPSEVQNLSGSYAEAMAKHQEKFENNKMKVIRWKVALFDVANLPGSHFKNGSEAQFIKGIVENISQKLNYGLLRRHYRQPEQHRLSDTESRGDFQMLIGRNGFEEIDANRNKVFLGSPNKAHPKILGTSSYQKESKLQQNEGFMMVLPSFAASTSKDREEFLVPKMSVVQCNALSNVPHSEEIGMKKRKCIWNGATREEATAQQKQTWEEITFAQLVESIANQGSSSKQFEGGLNATELNGNPFASTLNGTTSMEALCVSLGAETNAFSIVQDAGNVSTRTHEESKCAMQLLQTFVSVRFPELLHPAGSKFMEDTLNNLLNFSEDYKISVRMRSVVRQLLNSFIQWSQDYENANIEVKSTTAELSKVSDLEEGLATIVKESKKAVSSEKELCSQLACLEEENRQLEEQLMAVNAEITDLTSSKRAATDRKRSLLDKERELKAKMDDSIIRVPRLRADHEAAMLTQANIEVEWSKLQELYTNIFMLDFGSS